MNVFRVFNFFALSLLAGIDLATAVGGEVPAWWGNNIGKESIVLPGFKPITVSDRKINLGAGRSYRWKSSVLPQEIRSRNHELVTANKFLIVLNGKTFDVPLTEYRLVDHASDHVDIITVGDIDDSLKVKVKTHIEYDGVAMIAVELEPQKPVQIERFHHVVNIRANQWAKLLAFKPDSVYARQKRVVFKPSYSGEFLNALAVVDGDKSFWWFADNAEGWENDVNDVTEVRRIGNIIEITQKLIDKKIELTKEKHFQFNFLPTPVKDIAGNIRQNRFARNITSVESEYHGVNVWWITAFSHQVLPYVNYPPGVKAKLPQHDIDVYPGLANNRDLLAKDKKLDIYRLPYFSAHMLNYLDPAYKQFSTSWEVHPRRLSNRAKSDDPFTLLRDDALLTHRATGYTDYLISRFSELIDQLGFDGLYFDQASVVSTRNPVNGLWRDSKGRARASTDILALRDFHKRLATLFYRKGKKGLIFSHNSNTAIVPAYTFVTALVQGEEYNHWLKDYDYIKSVDLAEIRTRIGSSAFGVPTMWLEVLKSAEQRLDQSRRPYAMNKEEWLSSPYYEKGWENFMALALLHDMPTWTYAPVAIRNEVFSVVDWVVPETARFVGYWTLPPESYNNQMYYSYYLSNDARRMLLVISNLGEQEQSIGLDKLRTNVDASSDNYCPQWNPVDLNRYTRVDSGLVTVKAKSFKLLPVVCR